MVRIAERGSESVGVIDPVVAALQDAGVVLEVEFRDGRGDPVQVWLDGTLDRDAVAARFDLGPLLQWWPSEHGWQLVDTTTGTRTQARRNSDRVVGPSPTGGARVRAGYADQDARLVASSWVAPDPAVELHAVREARDSDKVTGSMSDPWDYWSFVRVADPEGARARVEEVLGAVLPGLAAGTPPEVLVERLPAWFRERCAAPHVPGSGPVVPPASSPGMDLDAEEATHLAARTARWATYWTAENWLRAMTPDERTWCWSSYDEVEPGVVRLRHRRRVLGAPVGSLKWLLHVAGATACVPPPWPVDQDGRRVDPAAAPSPDPPQRATGSSSPWGRVLRRLRGS